MCDADINRTVKEYFKQTFWPGQLAYNTATNPPLQVNCSVDGNKNKLTEIDFAQLHV